MKKWLKRLAAAGALIVVALAGFCAWECRNLPSDQQIRSRLTSHYSPRGRTKWVPLAAISPKLQAAVIDWEDPTFYSHHGLVFQAIWQAAMEDIRAHRYLLGGSTITQQVAKNLFLGPQKTLRRKLREAVLAVRIEHTFSKAEILEVYLNVAQWGDGFAGAEVASETYFGKPAAALSWDEAALLAGILPNPHLYNPLKDPQEAHRRRDVVLKVLLDDGDLSRQEYFQAVSAPCCALAASATQRALGN
jgi:membrane peptidoglycan carboxypeptidase